MPDATEPTLDADRLRELLERSRMADEVGSPADAQGARAILERAAGNALPSLLAALAERDAEIVELRRLLDARQVYRGDLG